VIRLGSWARGHEAKAADLAIAFYLNGRLLHSYSTLDIAKTSKNVSQSSNHYEVFESILGYERGAGIDLFRVNTVDGRSLAFNMASGLSAESAGKGRMR